MAELLEFHFPRLGWLRSPWPLRSPRSRARRWSTGRVFPSSGWVRSTRTDGFWRSRVCPSVSIDDRCWRTFLAANRIRACLKLTRPSSEISSNITQVTPQNQFPDTHEVSEIFPSGTSYKKLDSYMRPSGVPKNARLWAQEYVVKCLENMEGKFKDLKKKINKS